MSFLATQCPRCKLVQSAQPKCRRCEKTLPEPVEIAGCIHEASMLFPEPLPTAAEMEMQLIREALRRADGNGERAAQMIGIGKTTLYRKLKESPEAA